MHDAHREACGLGDTPDGFPLLPQHYDPTLDYWWHWRPTNPPALGPGPRHACLRALYQHGTLELGEDPTHLEHGAPGGPLLRAWTEVWTPRLTIANQQQAWRSFPGSVEILPDGEVILRQKLWGYFSQPLNLRNFPQDQQKLTIHMVAAGLRESEVQMVPLQREDGEMSGIAKVFSVPDFDVLSWKVEPRPFIAFEGLAGTAGFQMEIEVRRRVDYFVIKVIIPLCLIVIMSWIPRWIDPREIGANLGISATSVLTLIAYLFAITVLLPPVSYITHMDRFILLSTIMVFASLLHTVLDTALIRRGKTALVERINIWSRGIFPLALLIVLALSFEL